MRSRFSPGQSLHGAILSASGIPRRSQEREPSTQGHAAIISSELSATGRHEAGKMLMMFYFYEIIYIIIFLGMSDK